MYLLPLLNSNPGLKRVLSDQESVFLADVISSDTSGEMTSSIGSMVMDCPLPDVDSFENTHSEDLESEGGWNSNSALKGATLSDSSFSSKSVRLRRRVVSEYTAKVFRRSPEEQSARASAAKGGL